MLLRSRLRTVAIVLVAGLLVAVGVAQYIQEPEDERRLVAIMNSVEVRAVVLALVGYVWWKGWMQGKADATNGQEGFDESRDDKSEPR